MHLFNRGNREANKQSSSQNGVRRVLGWTTLLLSASLIFTTLTPRIIGSEQDLEREKSNRFQEHEDSDVIRLRAKWYFDQRAFPLGFIPAGARTKAIEQMQQMRVGQTGLQAISPDIAGPAWISVGPSPDTGTSNGNTTGRVNTLVVDPCDNSGNTVYLGGADGGLWRSTDGGNSWTPLTDSQPSLSMGSVALDTSSCPSGHPNAIYIGTGEENFAGDNIYGEGVLKSTDGGATWTVFGASAFAGASPFPLNSGISGPFIGALSIQPGNNQTLLAAVQGSGSALQSGIWRSTNGGANWTHVLPTPTKIVGTDVVFDPNDVSGKTAFAALGNPQGNSDPNFPNGVYKSTDGGITWSKLSVSPALQPSFGRISLAVGPSTPGSTPGGTVIFASIADSTTGSNNLLGVFKSTNGGASWTQLSDPLVTTNGFCNSQCFYDMPIRVNPANPNIVIAGGGAHESIVRSLDGGSTWAEISNNRTTVGPHVDTHAFAFTANGGTVFVGNDGGVWSSSNYTNPAAASVTWTNLNQGGLAITQFYPNHSIHPSNQLITYGGTQDNGLEKNTGMGPAWQDFGIGCDGGFTAVNQQIPSTVYGTCEYIPNRLLIIAACFFDADQCGNNGINAILGINPGDRGNFIPPLVIDPSNGNKLYFGTFRVWQTTNGGASWSSISPDLTLNGPSGPVLNTIVVAPTDSNTIYTGSSDSQVQVTTNGGASWANMSVGLPPRTVTAVVVDPKVKTTVCVTFSGFSGFGGDLKGHIFQSTTGGTNWTDITGNLPNIPVNDLVVDPDVPNTLYAATDIGVFVTSNANQGPTATWAPLGTGLPVSVVLSLRLHEPSRTLLAATHGRSVWELSLNNFTPAFNLASVFPVSVNQGAALTVAVLTGNGFTANSKANLNGSTLATNLTGPGQLTATIPPSSLTMGGVSPITVTDPGQANPTNGLPFTVLFPPPGNLVSVAPNQVNAGSGNLPIVVKGTGFANGATVFFNLASIPTVFQDSSTLNATIPASALTSAGMFPIDVLNPQPGGGPEPGNSLSFTVTAAPDFSFGGGVSPTSRTITAGQPATFAVPIAAANGFSSMVTLSASGLPTASNANFVPNPVSPGSSSTLTITTTARTLVPPATQRGPWSNDGVWLLLAALALATAVTLKLQPRRRIAFGLVLGLLAAIIVVQSGCGNKGGDGGGGGGGTPAGTSTITISGTGGGVTHTTAVTLTVQ